MTFITGPGLTTKTTPIIDSKPQEHVVEMCTEHGHVCRGGAPAQEAPPRYILLRPPFSPRMFVFLMGLLLTAIVAFGLLLYKVEESPARRTLYHGYCTVSIRDDDEGPLSTRLRPAYNAMPVRWSQDNNADTDVQLFSSESAGEADELVKTLRERFDIGDQVEKISVMDNGKRVNFIHDFEQNTTDIEDAERCFTTELDRETVLPPSVLMLSIEDGAVFDTARIRSELAAQLPALAPDEVTPALKEACKEKPVYRLLKQEFNIIRKRSADAPAHDYIQFSGRGIQEIEISNLAEILQHEQDAAIAQR